MLSLLELKQPAFGLDISDFSLKIVKLKKKGRFFDVEKDGQGKKRKKDFFDLASFNEVKIKPGIVRKGEIKKPDELAEIIKKAIKEIRGEKLGTKNAIISLSEERAFLQVIQMPKLSKDDLKSAVIFEAENHIPLAVEEVCLDYQVLSLSQSGQEIKNGDNFQKEKGSILNGDSDRLDVLIAAFPKKIIDSYLYCFKKSNIRPIALETESLAICRSLIKNERADKPVLLIDFGANRTIFIIFAGNSVRFTSSIPVSSHSFSEAISRTMKISLDEAEKLKIKYGLEEKIKLQIKNEKSIKSVEKGIVFEALIPILTDLIEQIKRYLNYYETHDFHEHFSSTSKKVEKILICGSGAKLKGFVNFLSSELKIPVEVGNPWINVLPHSSQPKEQTLIYQKEQSLGYATALGLALRGIKK